MSSRPRRRVSLPTGKKFHFNVIYNNAKSKLSTTPDTELSLKVTEKFIELAKGWGYDLSYYVERDALPGQNIFSELFTVIDSSMFTIVIMTNGFLSNCWAKYCQLSAFKSLLDSSEPASTSKMIPVLIGISDKQILRNLSLNRYVSFTLTDWKTDKPEWEKVRQMMKDQTLVPGQTNSANDLHSDQTPIQETGTPGTIATPIAQAEDTPSLTQFNRPPPETDGPRSSHASAPVAHVSRSQREKSQRQDRQSSGNTNTQQVAVVGASATTSPTQMGRSTATTSPPQTGRSTAMSSPPQTGRSTAATSPPQTGRSTAATSPPQTGRYTAATSPLQTGRSTGNEGPNQIKYSSSTTVPNDSRTQQKRSDGFCNSGNQQAAIGGASAGGKTSTHLPQTSNTATKGQNPTQEQDLLRREIKSTTHVIQVPTEQTTTMYSTLPDQQFISSPPGPSITIPKEASANGMANDTQQTQAEVIRLESQDLTNDMPSMGQSGSSKRIIPPGDISGNLRQHQPSSPDEETELKQQVNTITTTSAESTRSTPISDSGIGSLATTPSPSLDPYTAMTYQFSEPLSTLENESSEELQTKLHVETTSASQMAAPPMTQISETDKSPDRSGTLISQLPSNIIDSEARSNISSSRSEDVTGAGDTTKSDRIFDSIGSMQNQSDLDLDHGSFPSGDCKTAISTTKSERNETSPKGDNSDQTSARKDNSDVSTREHLVRPADEGPVAVDSELSTSTLSLSSSTHPIEEEDNFTAVIEENQVSNKENTFPQKLSEPSKVEDVHLKNDLGEYVGSLPSQMGNKPESDRDVLKKDGSPGQVGFSNGKPRTRRASMSDIARPAMHMFGNWILKPALHVINGADQIYF